MPASGPVPHGAIETREIAVPRQGIEQVGIERDPGASQNSTAASTRIAPAAARNAVPCGATPPTSTAQRLPGATGVWIGTAPQHSRGDGGRPGALGGGAGSAPIDGLPSRPASVRVDGAARPYLRQVLPAQPRDRVARRYAPARRRERRRCGRNPARRPGPALPLSSRALDLSAAVPSAAASGATRSASHCQSPWKGDAGTRRSRRRRCRRLGIRLSSENVRARRRRRSRLAGSLRPRRTFNPRPADRAGGSSGSPVSTCPSALLANNDGRSRDRRRATASNDSRPEQPQEGAAENGDDKSPQRRRVASCQPAAAAHRLSSARRRGGCRRPARHPDTQQAEQQTGRNVDEMVLEGRQHGGYHERRPEHEGDSRPARQDRDIKRHEHGRDRDGRTVLG